MSEDYAMTQEVEERHDNDDPLADLEEWRVLSAALDSFR